MPAALNPKFVDTTIKFIETASFGMKRACDELGVHRAMQKKASALQQPVFDVMEKIGAIMPNERDAAKAMLGAHDGTLQLLKNAVDEVGDLRQKVAELTGQANVNRLGSGVDEDKVGGAVKTAADSLNSPFVGRPSGEKKASDLAILRVLDTPGR